MPFIIKYGIGRNYLPDWGFKEALREIYQNFTDWGDFDVEHWSPSESIFRVQLSNDYSPESMEFLKIGESGKRGTDAIGKHGEGLKMASLVLWRLGYEVTIEFGQTRLESTFYKDEFLGECFGYLVYALPERLDQSKFIVTFDIPKEEYMGYLESQLTDEDVIHNCEFNGALINKPAGEVYVGGQFVAVVDGLKYAYNFLPKCVSLDRDRKVPRDFDVNWTASKILESWGGLKARDLSARDASYAERVPDQLAKKFKPTMRGNKVVFKAGIFTAPDRIAPSLMKLPINQKRVAKLKYKVSRKRTPHAIVKEFLGKVGILSPEAKVESQVLLKKAKNWKAK